ncbi:MAG TPA: hypothetical protein VNA57_05915 [Acidimicrobiales bacterium]|nr:hypothetical protein [Acidimicrobiales bacterium]
MLVTVAIAFGFLAASAAPASAHSAAGVSATNYLTRLERVTPEVPGVKMRVVESGSRFEVVNTTDQELVVIGYQEEPYLRIGPGGVFENRRSPATYVNASRRGTSTVPGSADPEAAPVWKKISDGDVARWHDHRIHWMGDRDPPAVRRAPDRRHVVIPEWTIAMRIGERDIEARGDLLWVPGPSAGPWLALAVVLLAGVTALALTRAWGRWLAVVTGALVIADVVHVVGTGFAEAGSVGTKIASVAGSSLFSVIVWIAGAVAVWMLARRRPEGLYAAAFAGVFIALLGGVADLGDLSHSQVPFAWGDTLARVLVGVSLGAGLGVLGAAVVGLRRSNETGRTSATATAAVAKGD